jgi:aminoglycoside phosphotransferase
MVPERALHAVRARLGGEAEVEVLGEFPYSTTNRTIELGAVGPGGAARLLLKQLHGGARVPAAVGTRPSFVEDPWREVALQRSGISALGLAPACWATSPDGESPWVLIEKVDGDVLWQLEDGRAWDEAARTLARLHDARADRLLGASDRERLLVHDRTFHRRWARRAIAGCPDRRSRTAVRFLARRADAGGELLEELPRTLVHGEAYASNILVERNGATLLVDWEMAALGCGVSDLAALAAGWDQTVVERLTLAYAGGLANRSLSTAVLLRAVDVARLQQCLQWLGWSQGWDPPEHHRQDWLSIGLAVASRLGP